VGARTQYCLPALCGCSASGPPGTVCDANTRTCVP
jgi:hypothetical protein